MGLSNSVSVIIPTYNAAEFLSLAIESAIKQSQPPLEIILIDDGSTDETPGIARGFGDSVRYIRQANQGVSSARNRGLAMARGEWVAFLDADDQFLPGKLERQLAVARQKPELDIVHSGWVLVDEAGKTLDVVEPWKDAPRLDLETWLLWKPVFPGALLMRTEAVRKVGGFDVSLSHAEDVDLILRMSLEGSRATWLREPTVRYRRHGNNVTRIGPAQAEGVVRVLDKFFASRNLPRKLKRKQDRIWYFSLMWVIWQLYQTGYQDSIRPYLSAALDHLDLPADLATLHVVNEFGKWLVADNRPISEARALRPILMNVAGMQATSWPKIEAALDWWESVWWPYLNGHRELGQQALAEFVGVDPHTFLKYAQYSLMASPQKDIVEEIGRLWEDSLMAGIIPAGRRDDVATLYFTAFSWSFFGRHWRSSAAALLRILRMGFGRGVLAAWWRFARSAVMYYIGGIFHRQEPQATTALLLNLPTEQARENGSSRRMDKRI